MNGINNMNEQMPTQASPVANPPTTMVRFSLTLDDYIAELNRRLEAHADYRAGMRVVRDPLGAAIGGRGGYTFEWPKPQDDDPQAWFDTRNVVDDVELQMREHYVLEEMADYVEQAA
ncbi:MAG TPA: hypothetical protein VH105_18955 [Burkholderiales bacterium]|nr:hypothetical protein [Burkholderiales bacterium]